MAKKKDKSKYDPHADFKRFMSTYGSTEVSGKQAGALRRMDTSNFDSLRKSSRTAASKNLRFPEARNETESFIQQVQSNVYSDNLRIDDLFKNEKDRQTTRNMTGMSRLRDMNSMGLKLNPGTGIKTDFPVAGEIGSGSVGSEGKESDSTIKQYKMKPEEAKKRREEYYQRIGLNSDEIAMQNDVYNAQQFMEGRYTNYTIAAASRVAGLDEEGAQDTAGVLTGLYDAGLLTEEEVNAAKDSGSRDYDSKKKASTLVDIVKSPEFLTEVKGAYLDANPLVKGSIAALNSKPVQKTLDFISRPLYGMGNMRLAALEMDQDSYANMSSDDKRTEAYIRMATLGFSGIHEELSRASDEILDDPSKLKELGSAFKEGAFKKKNEKILGSDVNDAWIKKMGLEGDKTVDNKMYRITAGLASDLGTDPLNLVGVGIGKTALKGVVKTAKFAKLDAPVNIATKSKASRDLKKGKITEDEYLFKTDLDAYEAKKLEDDEGITSIAEDLVSLGHTRQVYQGTPMAKYFDDSTGTLDTPVNVDEYATMLGRGFRGEKFTDMTRKASEVASIRATLGDVGRRTLDNQTAGVAEVESKISKALDDLHTSREVAKTESVMDGASAYVDDVLGKSEPPVVLGKGNKKTGAAIAAVNDIEPHELISAISNQRINPDATLNSRFSEQFKAAGIDGDLELDEVRKALADPNSQDPLAIQYRQAQQRAKATGSLSNKSLNEAKKADDVDVAIRADRVAETSRTASSAAWNTVNNIVAQALAVRLNQVAKGSPAVRKQYNSTGDLVGSSYYHGDAAKVDTLMNIRDEALVRLGDEGPVLKAEDSTFNFDHYDLSKPSSVDDVFNSNLNMLDKDYASAVLHAAEEELSSLKTGLPAPTWWTVDDLPDTFKGADGTGLSPTIKNNIKGNPKGYGLEKFGSFMDRMKEAFGVKHFDSDEYNALGYLYNQINNRVVGKQVDRVSSVLRRINEETANAVFNERYLRALDKTTTKVKTQENIAAGYIEPFYRGEKDGMVFELSDSSGEAFEVRLRDGNIAESMENAGLVRETDSEIADFINDTLTKVANKVKVPMGELNRLKSYMEQFRHTNFSWNRAGDVRYADANTPNSYNSWVVNEAVAHKSGRVSYEAGDVAFIRELTEQNVTSPRDLWKSERVIATGNPSGKFKKGSTDKADIKKSTAKKEVVSKDNAQRQSKLDAISKNVLDDLLKNPSKIEGSVVPRVSVPTMRGTDIVEDVVETGVEVKTGVNAQFDRMEGKLRSKQILEKKILTDKLNNLKKTAATMKTDGSSTVSDIAELSEDLKSIKSKHEGELKTVQSMREDALRVEKAVNEINELNPLERIVNARIATPEATGILSLSSLAHLQQIPGFTGAMRTIDKMNSPKALQWMVNRSAALRIPFGGRHGGPAKFTASIEKLFGSTGYMNSEFQAIRARYTNSAPAVTKANVDRILDSFGNMAPKVRERVHQEIISSKNFDNLSPEAQKVFNEYDRLHKYMSGQVYEPLTYDQIAGFFPKGRSFNASAYNKYLEEPTIDKFIDMVVRNKNTEDSLALVHQTVVSIEQAFAVRSMGNDIAQHGVKMDHSPVGLQNTELLKSKGWVNIHHKHFPEGADTLFDPNIVPSINHMLDMTDPRTNGLFLKIIDSVHGYWKMALTTYNPGYYPTTLLGEVSSAYLAGVHNPLTYKNSGSTIRFMKHNADDPDLINIGNLDDFELGSDLAKGNVVGKRYGTNITQKEAAILYRMGGNEGGFLNTEAVRAGRRVKAPKFHRSVVNAGERLETHGRMATFLHHLERAPSKMSIREATEYASEQVRRYHFDYADLSPFEKAVMGRWFPFYTFTRKAMPLAVKMIALKPYKAVQPYKFLANVSRGATEDLEVTDGILPNEEMFNEEDGTEWMSGRGYYKFSNKGNGLYMRSEDTMSIGQSRLDNPGYLNYILTNPAAKIINESPGGLDAMWEQARKSVAQNEPIQDIQDDEFSLSKLAEWGSGMPIVDMRKDDKYNYYNFGSGNR